MQLRVHRHPLASRNLREASGRDRLAILGPPDQKPVQNPLRMAHGNLRRRPQRTNRQRGSANQSKRQDPRQELGHPLLRSLGAARSGETVTDAHHPASAPLEGYLDPLPMVFCGLYPVDGDELTELRDSLEKLRLNDASFTYEPESSQALGFGFRCGFLGLLHMEIIRERLEREFNLSLIATAPSVAYVANLTDGTKVKFDNPSEMPDPSRVDHIDEPVLRVTLISEAATVAVVGLALAVTGAQSWKSPFAQNRQIAPKTFLATRCSGRPIPTLPPRSSISDCGS